MKDFIRYTWKNNKMSLILIAVSFGLSIYNLVTLEFSKAIINVLIAYAFLNNILVKLQNDTINNMQNNFKKLLDILNMEAK